MSTPKPQDWSLAQIWNAVAIKPDRPLVKRDYVYASELGQPMCDRIMKMNAMPYTNPPNDRSRRKFLAGNIFEYVVKQILTAAGIYLRDEVKLDANPYKDTLGVHGRCDFQTIHGHIDLPRALSQLHELILPEELYRIGTGVIHQLEGIYMQGKILELKAVSTFAMDKVEKTKMAIPSHSLQAYHYQKTSGIPANIAYVCKDDMRMAQFFIDEKATESLYKSDLEMITHYYKKKKTPPTEPLAMFNTLMGKFSKNLGVEYSPYLTSLYGYKNPEEYRDAVKFVTRWNNCLTRYVKAALGMRTPTGKPIEPTPLNKQVRSDIEATKKFNFDELIQAAIAAGVSEEEEAEF